MPYFLTFEGGEGAGKTTQIKKLEEYFNLCGIPCLFTREPGGTPNAEAIRTLLLQGESNKWDWQAETLLFLAARQDHLTKKIWPNLSQGKIVVCDRFLDSTLVYQCFARDRIGDIEKINSFYQFIAGDFYPDCTIILDIEPEIGVGRSLSRSNIECRFENMDMAFHQKVRQGFLSLAKNNPRYAVIDANRSIDLVFQDILNALQKRKIIP